MASAGDPAEDDESEPDSRARLMHEVAEQMDGIEADFGDDYEIGRVITIVEVLKPGGGGDSVRLRVRAEPYPWVALGMLDVAKKIVEEQIASPE